MKIKQSLFVVGYFEQKRIQFLKPANNNYDKITDFDYENWLILINYRRNGVRKKYHHSAGKLLQLGFLKIVHFKIVLDNTKNACVAVTQPRRVAASSLAMKVAHDRNCTLGEEVC